MHERSSTISLGCWYLVVLTCKQLILAALTLLWTGTPYQWTLTGICFVLLFCGRNHGLSSQLERTEHTLPLTVMEMETQGLRLLEGVKTFALRSDRPLPPTPHTSCWKRLLRPSARRVASFRPAAHTKQGLSKKLLYRSVTTSLPQWLPQCTSSLSACLVLV